MKRLLFVCSVDLCGDGTIGIQKKIASQLELFDSQENLQVDYAWRENGLVRSNLLSLFNRECRRADDLNAFMERLDTHYDFAYIRFNRFSVQFLRLLKKLSMDHCRIILEIPTYPFDQEERIELQKDLHNHSWMDACKVVNKICCNHFLPTVGRRYIDRIATYSLDTEIWKIPTVRISNGIRTHAYDPCKINHTEHEIHLICVSSCLPWHGYDRLIQGLGKYYADHGMDQKKPKVTLMIVGKGEEEAHYLTMI